MRVLYVLCGPPGAGKSTLAKEISSCSGGVLRSYDDMPGANTRYSINGGVKKSWLGLVREDLIAGNDVVCDGLFIEQKDRLDLLERLQGISCKKVLLVVLPPLDVCLDRNRKRQARLPDFVVRQAYSKYEPPTECGWDVIEEVLSWL